MKCRPTPVPDSCRRRCSRELSLIPRPTPLCWFGRHRSRLQDRHRPAPQAIWNVLDGSWRQCHPGAAMLPPQWSIRVLLGGAGSLILTFMSRLTESCRARGRQLAVVDVCGSFDHRPTLARGARGRRTRPVPIAVHLWITSTSNRISQAQPGILLSAGACRALPLEPWQRWRPESRG